MSADSIVSTALEWQLLAANWTHYSQPIPVTFEILFIIYHTNRAHLIKVSFCQCGGPAGGYLYPNQLLHSLWFPASLTCSKTVFTFAVLKHFHHLTLQGKTTAYNFYNLLVHKTDNTEMKPPPVSTCLIVALNILMHTQKCYDEFLKVVWWWRYIKMLKYAGHGCDPGGVAATCGGKLAVLYPACLQPGKNLPVGYESLIY